MKTLQTARLILRPWRLTDAPAMYEYARHPRVGPMAGWKPHEHIVETETILKRFIREDETWAIVLRQSDTVIGSIGLHANRQQEITDAREIGYVLAEPYWGQGLMPEAVRAVIAFAFTELRLEHLLVAHFPFNRQSRRVIDKCGFTWLKHLQASWQCFDGTWYDEEVYILNRETFFAGQPSDKKPTEHRRQAPREDMMLTTAYPIREIAENTYEIDEFDCASCFLLIGQEKAMLIDTGVGIGDLAGAVRQLTDKPLITVLTHGHVDHVGNAWQFDACYLNEKDWGQTDARPDPRSDVTQRRRYADMIAHRQQGDHPSYPYDPQVDIREWARQPKWLPLHDGDRFDLGGGRVITAHACPGHTPGQIALLDAAVRILFVGDAVNGNIMFMSKPGQPGFTSVEKAHEGLTRLRDLGDQYDRIFNGHHDYRPFGQPLPDDVLPDAIDLCQQLISGDFTPKYEKNPMVGWPDQLAVHKGITRIAYTLEGIHEPGRPPEA